MKYSTIALSIGLGLAAMQAAPAMTYSGSLNGSYTTQDFKKYAYDTGNLNAAVLATFDDLGLNAQVGGGYTRDAFNSVKLNTWNFNGDVFWRNDMGMIGASFDFKVLDIAHESSTYRYKIYSLFGEWYAMDALTLRVRGGGANGENKMTGGYVTAGAEYYATPDFGMIGDFSYDNFSTIHWKTLNLGAEYLVSHEYPLSISAMYTYTKYVEGSDLSSSGVMFRLNYRFGLNGSLVQLDRHGPVPVVNYQFPMLANL
jgi:hypothetical protein